MRLSLRLNLALVAGVTLVSLGVAVYQVAKEYIVARHDGRDALILSRFTGASHELADALIVNPYDTDELAQSIHSALEMSPEEAKGRMHAWERP